MSNNQNLRWTNEQIEELRKLAEAGGSIIRAAAKFKRTRSAITTIAHKKGIKFKSLKTDGSRESRPE